jgi:hypothetical protein
MMTVGAVGVSGGKSDYIELAIAMNASSKVRGRCEPLRAIINGAGEQPRQVLVSGGILGSPSASRDARVFVVG